MKKIKRKPNGIPIVPKVKKKGGRPLDIKTPEELEALFEGYRRWCEENPFIMEDFGGNPPEIVRIKKQRPMTIMGFDIYLGKRLGNNYIHEFTESDSVKKCPEFSQVISRMREQISNEQVSGAMTGVFHHNLVARVNGISEKVDNTYQEKKKTVDDLFPPESELDDATSEATGPENQ